MKKDLTRLVRLVVRGNASDDDRPSAADVIDQISDFLGLLRELEQGSYPNSEGSELVWRVAGARMQSPLRIDLIGEPRRHGYDVTERVVRTKRAAVIGLRGLSERSERPPYFTDQALETAQRIFHRVTNGLSQSDFADPASKQEVTIRADTAARAERHVGGLLQAPKRATATEPVKGREIGSIEGVLVKGDRWYGHPAFYVRDRRSGLDILCLPTPALAERLGEKTLLRDVWHGKRVKVSGVIEYSAPGQIKSLKADDVYEFPSTERLPVLADILDPSFTDKLSPIAYLERMRSGEEA